MPALLAARAAQPPAAATAPFDPEIASIFTEEATELLESVEAAIAEWRAQPDSAELRSALKRPLHTLKGGARMAGIAPMGDLSHELESLVLQIDQGVVPTTPATFNVLQASIDELARMREAVAMGRRLSPAHEAIARIQALAPSASAPAPAAGDEMPAVHTAEPDAAAPLSAPAAEAPAVSEFPAGVPDMSDAFAEVFASPPEVTTPGQEVHPPAAFDVGALEPAAPVEKEVQAYEWTAAELTPPDSQEEDATPAPFELPAALFDIEPAPSTPSAPAYVAAAAVEEILSTPAAMMEPTPESALAAEANFTAPQAVEIPLSPPAESAPAPEPTAAAAAEDTDLSPPTAIAALPVVPPAPLPYSAPSMLDDILLPPQPVPPGREPVPPGDRPEMARVDAELLDQMLNTSGEVSIARARLEQQLGSIDFNLGELSRTVTRLKEQLRKLEIETETQILHGHEEKGGGHRGDFDPLELDRYSSIQQFSRALAETASAVASIQQ